jgi:hypothetical protein
MRPILIGFALFPLSVILFAACGPTPGSAATGTGGAPNCEGVYIVEGDTDGGEPCDICLHDNCCPELSNCRDKACIDCVNTLLPSCRQPPRAVNDCSDLHCADKCGSSHPTVIDSGADSSASSG